MRTVERVDLEVAVRQGLAGVVLAVVLVALAAGPVIAHGASPAFAAVQSTAPLDGEPSPVELPVEAEPTDAGPSPGIVAAGVFLAIVAVAGAIARYRSL